MAHHGEAGLVKNKNMIIAALAVVVGVVAVVYLLPSEQRKIKKQFAALSDEVSKEQGESLLAMAYTAQTLPKLFDTNCAITVKAEMITGSYTPEEIASLAARARTQFSTLKLSFSDLKIDISEKNLAKVELTARLVGKGTNNEGVNEVRELMVTLKKCDGRWLFSSFDEVEVLKK
jgi:hypothetical protein